MAESSAQLLTRITVLLEQLIDSEKEEVQKFGEIARNALILEQHGDKLATRLEESAKQRAADQGELRALFEALRMNIRHDTANMLGAITLQDAARKQRLKTPPETAVTKDKSSEELHLTVQGNIPVKTILIASGAAISTFSGWLWHYRNEIARLFGP